MAFEDVLANYEAARKGQGMLRSDYYGNEFAIQNQLDAALMQKEAERIMNDPVLLAQFLRESGMSSDALPDTTDRSPISIGIGARTDEIGKDATIAAIRGLFTGGLSGALMGGAKSYIMDIAQTLSDVNKSSDPIATLNALQRWTAAPVESRSGQTPAEIQAAIAREINQQSATRMQRQEGVGESSGGGSGGQDGRGGQRDSALTGYTE